MRNIRLTIEYDGSRYQGWIRLGKEETGSNTISGKIMEVLKKMTGEYSIELNCGSRTEVGVHAYAQVANFKTQSTMDVLDIKHYLNRYLPMDIHYQRRRSAGTLSRTIERHFQNLCLPNDDR